jgi:hypothetical protein
MQGLLSRSCGACWILAQNTGDRLPPSFGSGVFTKGTKSPHQTSGQHFLGFDKAAVERALLLTFFLIIP